MKSVCIKDTRQYGTFIDVYSCYPIYPKKTLAMNSALLVRLEAKPGKEREVVQFLKNGLQMVEDEPDTISWFAMRLGFSTFAIFNTFPNDMSRQQHLTGEIAKAITARASQLFVHPPVIEKADVLAAKMPEPEFEWEPAY